MNVDQMRVNVERARLKQLFNKALPKGKVMSHLLCEREAQFKGDCQTQARHPARRGPVNDFNNLAVFSKHDIIGKKANRGIQWMTR
jgi:hypothetical protein